MKYLKYARQASSPEEFQQLLRQQEMDPPTPAEKEKLLQMAQTGVLLTIQQRARIIHNIKSEPPASGIYQVLTDDSLTIQQKTDSIRNILSTIKTDDPLVIKDINPQKNPLMAGFLSNPNFPIPVLYCAMELGLEDITRMLIRHHPEELSTMVMGYPLHNNQHCRWQGMHVAVATGNTNMAETVLNEGGNINQHSPEILIITPLDLAIRKNDGNMQHFLRNKGAKSSKELKSWVSKTSTTTPAGADFFSIE